MNDKFRHLLEKATQGDQAALARCLTLVERAGAESLRSESLLKAPRIALRIGITGPPGAGKSTLVGELIRNFREKGLKVGVIAVDPSSPYTQGAILGDRIRYSEHFSDEGVFIRSLGTRGALGGLSASAYLMLRVFDACNFDLVLVETVGVGQTELDIIHVADQVCVVLVPEAGDSIQAMKAGLVEIADVFVVNKADRPGADLMARDLEGLSQLAPVGSSPKQVQVFQTVARDGTNVKELGECFLKSYDRKNRSTELSEIMIRKEAEALLRMKFHQKIRDRAAQVKSLEDLYTAVVEESSLG